MLITVLWLTFACGLPLRQVHEARRQAYLQLNQSFTTDTAHKGDVLAAFDSSNQALDIAAFGPCLMLAVTILLLLNQLLKLKRRYNALERDLTSRQGVHLDTDGGTIE